MMALHLMGFGNRGGMLMPVMSHVKRHVYCGSLGHWTTMFKSLNIFRIRMPPLLLG